jgi:hypothetical protein
MHAFFILAIRKISENWSLGSKKIYPSRLETFLERSINGQIICGIGCAQSIGVSLDGVVKIKARVLL